jgi:hypothetical protein
MQHTKRLETDVDGFESHLPLPPSVSSSRYAELIADKYRHWWHPFTARMQSFTAPRHSMDLICRLTKTNKQTNLHSYLSTLFTLIPAVDFTYRLYSAYKTARFNYACQWFDGQGVLNQLPRRKTQLIRYAINAQTASARLICNRPACWQLVKLMIGIQ